RAVQLAPADGNARAHYAWYLALNGQFEAADAEAEKALGLGPNSVIVLNAVANVLNNAQRWDQAEPLYPPPIRLDPPDPASYPATLRATLHQHRQYSEGTRLASRYVERFPQIVTPAITLAAALGQLGRDREARAAAAELERRSPGFTITEYVRAQKQSARN